MSSRTQPVAASPVPQGTTYACPMHPEETSDHPDACATCGMTLEPTVPQRATRTEWTCPAAHPGGRCGPRPVTGA